MVQDFNDHKGWKPRFTIFQSKIEKKNMTANLIPKDNFFFL